MPIQQLQFKTSAFTGTARKESAGLGLSRVLMAGVKAKQGYDIGKEKDKEKQRVLSNREERDIAKADNIAFLDRVNDYKRLKIEANYAGMPSAQQKEFTAQYKEDNPNSMFVSPEYTAKYDNMFLSDNSVSAKLAVKEDAQLANDTLESLTQLSMDNMTMKEVDLMTSSLKELNPNISKTDVLKKTYKGAAGRFESDRLNGKIDDSETLESLQTKYFGPLGNEIKDKSLGATAGKALETFIERRQRSWNDKLSADSSQALLDGKTIEERTEIVNSNENASPEEKVKQHAIIDVAVKKKKAVQEKAVKETKKVVKQGADAYTQSITMSTDLPVGINMNKVKTFNSKGSQAAVKVVLSNIDTAYPDDGNEAFVMKQKIVETHAKGLKIAKEIANHKKGEAINSDYSSVSKQIIKHNTQTAFYAGILGGNYIDAANTVKTLGGLPAQYKSNLISSIDVNDKNSEDNIAKTVVMLQGLKKTDTAAYKLVTKDPLFSSIANAADYLVDENGNLNISKISTVVQNREQIKKSAVDIVKSVKRHNLKDYPYYVIERVAQEMAYDIAFGLEGSGDFKSDFEDKVESSMVTDGNDRILDTAGRYSTKSVTNYLSAIRATNSNLNEDSKITVHVSPAGKMDVYSGGVAVAVINNPKHLKFMISTLEVAAKDKIREEEEEEAIQSIIAKAMPKTITLATGETISSKDTPNVDAGFKKSWGITHRGKRNQPKMGLGEYLNRSIGKFIKASGE